MPDFIEQRNTGRRESDRLQAEMVREHHIALFGDPNDPDDHGMRGDMREVMRILKGGKFTVNVFVWIAGMVGTMAVAVQYFRDHFTLGIRP